MIRLTLLAAVLCAPGAALGAAPAQDCGAISDPAARLACYDERNRKAAPPTSPLPETAPPPAAAPAEGAAAPAADAAVDAAEFGKRKKNPVDDLQSIKARIVGKVTYWERGTEFRLDNGQVWKAIDQDSGNYTSIPENPEVKVTRGLFGAFWLEIVAVKARIKVKRVS